MLFSGTLRLVGCKIGNIKRRFHPKTGTIKYRNSKDLVDAEDIKTWKEYTEELYNKGLDVDNHKGGVTDLDPDILECEVKWVLGSITMIKVNGNDRIPVELLKI